MGSSQERKVGQRGQVTLPKELREKLDINRGDNAIIHDEKEKSLSRSQSVGKNSPWVSTARSRIQSPRRGDG
jgi:AbrB family looped-hinge helix DNA binding protein